ncbi:MAG TPA: DUF167 domain-containing protein [Negativicutes bacterium]
MLELTGLNYQEDPEGVSVKIRVQPRSSRNSLAGINGDSLKVTLTSPPVEGEANVACVNFMAKSFAVAKNQVSIIAGHKSRNKIVKITGINKADLAAVINKMD